MDYDLKVLYAEDEELIRKQMVQTLEFLSYKVDAVENGELAWQNFQQNSYDIVILDIEMSDLNGLELATKIRELNSTIPIIIISAYTNTEYFMKAIELNLVKYLIKPVKVQELEESLNLCAQSMVSQKSHLFYFNEKDFYDFKLQQLIVNNEEIHMEHYERELLNILVKNNQRTLSYREIITKIWEEEPEIGSLRSVVSSLRKKLPIGIIIKNIPQIGYRLFIDENN
ncbi:response regulator transcription factor [Sulfurospirillum arcachonense]|uniref:response regulator transcription factor n=1 Tax=Sulfurospirillum arcachonense TaxID=57666 RepID=UPI000469A09F|nr:response regulator transcription factor [Sulfurospirillum arcachonense]